MSINWVEVTHANAPLPIGQERFLRAGRMENATLKVSRPVAPTDSSQQTTLDMTASGTAFLSDTRIVFVSNPSNTSATSFKSFSVLYSSILGVKYEQPWWGGNYISFSLLPTPDGGLTGGVGAIVKCELRVDGRGLWDFCAAFQSEIERARQKKLDADTLPLYISSTAPPANASVVTGNSAASDLPPAYTI